MQPYLQRAQSPCGIVEFTLSTNLSSSLFHGSFSTPSSREFSSANPSKGHHYAYPVTNIEVCLDQSIVHFSTAEIREYNICIGNRPHGSTISLPLSLDWTYNPTAKTVDLTEALEHESQRRLAHQLTLLQRIEWLKSFYSYEAMWLMERDVRRQEERRLYQGSTKLSVFDFEDDSGTILSSEGQVMQHAAGLVCDLYDDQRVGMPLDMTGLLDKSQQLPALATS